MKLSDWARKRWISWRWFRAGKLRVPAPQLPTGTILVEEPNPWSARNRARRALEAMGCG